jgi:hypothetical protein
MGIAQLAFNLLDAALGKALLLARCVVLGVFLQITMRPGLGDGRDDARTFNGFQPRQFLAEFPGATRSNWNLVSHIVSSRCSCCRLMTLPVSR